jgi:crotonobetainyl-CoA:carnitine CoA-transferase CaiB-like acyl-CoA transferase
MPPELGEHTDEVLAELGRDTNAIARLRAEGIVA